MRVWISALVPLVGADTYDGVRVQASLSEEDCYRDLADWLEIEYESKEQVERALDEAEDGSAEESYGVEMWKVEEQEVAQ